MLISDRASLSLYGFLIFIIIITTLAIVATREMVDVLHRVRWGRTLGFGLAISPMIMMGLLLMTAMVHGDVDHREAFSSWVIKHVLAK